MVPRSAQAVGALPQTTVLHVDVVLQPRDPAGLAQFATAVSTPGSALYRHYLPAGAFPARFGPTSAAIAALEGSLRADGLQPGPISGNHLSIPVTATAGQLARAFSTSFEGYRLGSRAAYANTSAPLFPAAVAPYVQGVVGLDTLTQPRPLDLSRGAARRPAAARPQVVTGGPQPCSDAQGAAQEYSAYTADDLASAYNFSSLYGAGDEGSGITVALYELEPDLPSDIAAYQSCYGTDTSVNYIEVDGGAGSGDGLGEAALDIEDIIGLAPQATIDVYQAPNSNSDAYDNYTAIVSADTAQVISTSWGLCEAEAGSSFIADEATLFEQAAAQGQSVFAAAGDSGSEDCDTSSLAVDDPASQPYVTGVGGTTMSALGPPPTQTVWNESAIQAGAGGGGISSSNTMPSYQSGAPAALNVINANSSGTPCGASSGSYCREVPDVSADADPETGYVIRLRQRLGRCRWHECRRSALGRLHGAGGRLERVRRQVHRVREPGPLRCGRLGLYLGLQDITSGNNDYTGTNGGLYPAGPGYDMASGLGTPNGGNLAGTLCAGLPKNTVTVANPGAQSSVSGSAVSLQISGTDSGGLGLTYSASGLPPGLSISSAGLISGTPTTAGTYSVTVAAKDSTGATGSATFSWSNHQHGDGGEPGCAELGVGVGGQPADLRDGLGRAGPDLLGERLAAGPVDQLVRA